MKVSVGDLKRKDGSRSARGNILKQRLQEEPGAAKIRICVYCGDWHQCREHLLPLSWRRVYRNYALSETVAACLLCNALAGDFKADDVSEKAFYLLERYQKRYKRVLALPLWSMEEIAGLSGYLKRRIIADAALRELITTKLSNLDLVSNGFAPIPINPRDLQKYVEVQRRKPR